MQDSGNSTLGSVRVPLAVTSQNRGMEEEEEEEEGRETEKEKEK